MSAITVIYNLNGKPVGEEDIRIVLDSLKHRGSDDSGTWFEGNLGLGHRMRWSTPESRNEKQPSVCNTTGFVLTGDIRIDNREELIPLLFRNGKESQKTDCDIVLAAYQKWGEDFLPRLVGDFVFAIWDPKKRQLLCGRDTMGVKHFYYYHKPGKLFTLASEIKGLLCQREIPFEINEENIGDVLILNYQDKESTPVLNIKRLPANHAMIVNESGIRIWEYWRPSRPGFRRPRSGKYYAEEFRRIFVESVNCRMRSNGAAGTLLSGGLDSSSISAVASRFLDKQGSGPLETFSAIFPEIAEIDSTIDEREFIESLVKEISCTANYVKADAFTPLLDLDEMQSHADHPIGAPNMFMDWALFKKAKTRDVKVLLSGFDGDSTVSYGYEGFEYLAKRGRLLRLYKDATSLVTNMPHRRHNLKRLIWNLGIKSATPESLKRGLRVLRGHPPETKLPQDFPSTLKFNYNGLNPQFTKDKRLKARYFEILEKDFPSDVSPVEAHWNGLNCGLFAFALETFEKTGAAFDVEPRFPFFDRRLIEFSINLPPGQRILGGWTRSILRRAMEGIVPPKIQWRITKANIGLSFKVNLLKYSRERIEYVLSESSDRLGNYVDKTSLVAAYERYKTSPLEYDNEAMFLMSTIYLSNWLNKSSETARK